MAVRIPRELMLHDTILQIPHQIDLLALYQTMHLVEHPGNKQITVPIGSMYGLFPIISLYLPKKSMFPDAVF